MALDAGTMIKKHHVALFLNSGTPTVPVWTQIQKSTDNTITMNAETKVFDYIVDEAPTTEIDRYSPSLSQPLTMYKGEEDYEYVFDKFFEQSVGDDAHSDILVVFYGADVAATYKAWKCSAVLVMDNMNPTESTITVNVLFNGTTDQGTVTVTAGVPVFTSTSQTEYQLVITVLLAASEVEGASVKIGEVTKTTDEDGEVTFTLIDGEEYVVGAWDDDSHEIASVFTGDEDTTTMDLTIV
jgi:hypothetical protein